MAAPTSPLLVDLYQLTMGQAYFDAGLAEERGTFSLFYRTLPEGWGYLLAAGLEDVLGYLEALRFCEDDLAYLESTDLFTAPFLDHLRGLRFEGDVRAMLEGTLFFPQEPVLEVTAPVITAQVVETVVLNVVHFQSLVAGKAARSVDAARGRSLVDFGLRRAHGAEAGLKAARASYLAGFDSTSNVLAGREYGIPIAGTMAHSFVESFPDELEAFRAFARSYPDRAVMLVDTYDVVAGTRNAIRVARELAEQGARLRGVRIDSGDLVRLSHAARALLDEAGFEDAGVVVSGGLDEHDVAAFVDVDAPIAGFGIGTKMVVSADAPFLDMAYKLVELEGRPTVKLSSGKATLPGGKQVWRVAGPEGFAHDVVEREGEPGPAGGEPLLTPVVRAAQRPASETLLEARARAAAQRNRLPERHRRLAAEPYAVRVGAGLAALRGDAVRRAAASPSSR
ncbi:MAG: nicotinate phosphoribosyltransferase [Actinomycetota bacterium]|nr:nicotinate phosphoribosyltransferase [Actinomycetota bacterium]